MAEIKRRHADAAAEAQRLSGRHEAAIAVYQACRKHLGIDGTTMLATAEGV